MVLLKELMHVKHLEHGNMGTAPDKHKVVRTGSTGILWFGRWQRTDRLRKRILNELFNVLWVSNF